MFSEPMVNRKGHVSYGEDENLFVTFFKHPRKGVLTDYIEIIFPADTRSITRRPVKEQDKGRFSKHWEAYQKGETYKQEGFPLEQWQAMDEGMVREYNHHRIYTVEQLANLNETSLENLGLGARTLHTKAKAFVKANSNSKIAEKLAAQNEELKKQLADLTVVVKDLKEQVDKKQSKAKK